MSKKKPVKEIIAEFLTPYAESGEVFGTHVWVEAREYGKSLGVLRNVETYSRTFRDMKMVRPKVQIELFGKSEFEIRHNWKIEEVTRHSQEQWYRIVKV